MSTEESPKPNRKISNRPKQNLLNSIRNIRRDYGRPARGAIHEALQNMIDAYGRNFVKKCLIEMGLEGYFEIDSESNEILIRDNAGGMTEDILTENLIAIDNPSEHKDEGSGLGCLGRGVWVLLALGSVAHIEVNHPDVDGIMTTDVRTKADGSEVEDDEELVGYSDIEKIDSDDSELGLEDQYGTAYKISGIKEEFIDVLSDWEVMEQSLIERFAPLWTYFDDIELSYVIDGDEKQVDAPDLEDLKSDHMLRSVEDVKEFEYYDEKHDVQDAVFIDARDLSEAPWEGFLAFKGNEYFDHPFMTVDIYKPRLPSTMGKTKMFGWFDVTDVCRQRDDGRILENNSHTSINIKGNKWTKMGLKSIASEVHDNVFKNNRERKKDRESFQQAKNVANKVLTDMDFEDELDTKITGGKQRESTPPVGSDEVRLLNCKVGKRKYDIGEEICLFAEVNFPDDPSYESYAIKNIDVRRVDDGGEFSYDRGRNPVVKQSNDFRVGPPIAPEPDSGGKYRLYGELYGIKHSGETSDRSVASSQETFYVGDPPEKDDGPRGGNGDEAMGIVSNITHGTNQPVAALAMEDEDGEGLEVRLSTDDARVKAISENNRGDSVVDKTGELYAEWILTSVVEYWGEKEVENGEIEDFQEHLFKMRQLEKEMQEKRVTIDE